MRLWRPHESTRPIAEDSASPPHTRPITALAANDRFGASASLDTTVKLWDMHTLSCTTTLLGHPNSVLSLATTAHSRMLASGDRSGNVYLWDSRTCAPIGRVSLSGAPAGERSASQFGGRAAAKALAIQHCALFAAGHVDGTVRVWDLRRLHQTDGAPFTLLHRPRHRYTDLSPPTARVCSLVVSSCGRKLATGDEAGRLVLFEQPRDW